MICAFLFGSVNPISFILLVVSLFNDKPKTTAIGYTASLCGLDIPPPCVVRFLSEWDDPMYVPFRLDDLPANWPKTVGEIGDSRVQKVLKEAGKNAVGGNVYPGLGATKQSSHCE